MIPKYPKWAVITDTAPRSNKVTYWIAKLDENFEHPFYRTWAKAEYSADAFQRVKELNEMAEVRCGK